MSICKNGLNKMFTIINSATGDIKHRLWTLYWLARLAPGNYVVELGVRGGDSTRALLAACEDTGKTLFSYDLEDSQAVVRDRTKAQGLPWFQAAWLFFQSDSVAAARTFETIKPPGMVFVDTDHTYETTKAEIEAWSPRIVLGGCFVFHDYWLKADSPKDKRDGVKPAVDEWANRHPGGWVLETHDAGPHGDTGLAILWRTKE